MKKLLLLFLFLCSLEVAQAQPGISTAIPSEKPSKYQKDQIKRKYGISFILVSIHSMMWNGQTDLFRWKLMPLRRLTPVNG